MRFSPFNPIPFRDSGAQGPGGCPYVRTFAESDHLMVQIYHASDEQTPAISLLDGDGNHIAPLASKEYAINQDETMTLLEAFGFSAGCYRIGAGKYVSDPFRVRPDDDLDGTVLVQYAFRDNRGRDDVLTKIFGGVRYFDLRLPGGFKDADWMFKVDNEQYQAQSSDVVELSAVDYTDKVLTLGESIGIDVETAELVNRIFTCPLVFVDGVRYARIESSAPEAKGGFHDGTAVYSITLREAHSLDAEMEQAVRLNLRRTPTAIRRAAGKLRRVI